MVIVFGNVVKSNGSIVIIGPSVLVSLDFSVVEASAFKTASMLLISIFAHIYLQLLIIEQIRIKRISRFKS